jgi:hypothetical protein
MGASISVKELNARNRTFWDLESAKTERRIADPLIFQRAVADIDSETRRLVPPQCQKSFEEALQEAEALYEDPSFKQRVRRELSQLGGTAKKTDKLQALILEAVRGKPSITELELLGHLQSLEDLGVIQEIAGGCIYFTNYGERTKKAPLSGLKDRLSRAKKALRSS